MQAHDAWIGWSDEQRKRNLQWIVNNGRFLVLPIKDIYVYPLVRDARQGLEQTRQFPVAIPHPIAQIASEGHATPGNDSVRLARATGGSPVPP